MTWLSKKLSKMRGNKEETVQFTLDVDMPAISDFLRRTESDLKELRELARTLQELHKEHQAITPDKKQENIRKQILVFDKLMLLYSFYEDETDINGNRLKGLREDFKKKALDHPKLWEKLKDEPRWYEDW